MPVRHVSGLRGARCTGAGEGVQNSRLHPVIPGSAGPGPGRGRTQVRSNRCGAPKGERSRKGSRLYLVTGAVLYPCTVRCSASLVVGEAEKAWPTFGPIIATRHNAPMQLHRENEIACRHCEHKGVYARLRRAMAKQSSAQCQRPLDCFVAGAPRNDTNAVIAGLDPAIHAAVLRLMMDVVAFGTSAWTTGSSPVVTE